MANLFKNYHCNFFTATKIILCGFLIVTTFIAPLTLSLTVDQRGYYDITVAISDKTAWDGNEKYLDNLKKDVQDLSDAIWESTEKKFSIRSADILIPSHWHVEQETLEPATTQHYQSADIRISHEYLVPQSINPVFCAYPGNYIELPYNFFDTVEFGPWGPTGRALLTLWARFRWGVHEEHGYPGDGQFPYFWKWVDEEDEDSKKEDDHWRVTSCHNTQVIGEILTVDKAKCPFQEDGLYGPPTNCRFFPDEGASQTATSSLMSFHFVKPLKYFCTEDNHDKRGPNRQNFYCQYKSAWETIRESPEFQFRDQSAAINERNPIQYKIVKPQSTKPLLYILVDGLDKPPEEITSAVGTGLEKILLETSNWDVLAQVSVYPTNDKRKSYQSTSPTGYPLNFPFMDVATFLSNFKAGLGSLNRRRPPGLTPPFKDFGRAIQEIGVDIRARKHAPGAIILILKYGTEPPVDQDYFSRDFYPAFESDVLATLLEQNIRLFAIEGEDSIATDGYRLKNIAEMTGGMHVGLDEVIPPNKKITEEVDTMMTKIGEIMTDGHIPKGRYRVAYRSVFANVFPVIWNNEDAIKMSIVVKNVEKLTFYFNQLQGDTLSPPFATTYEEVKFLKGPFEDIVVDPPEFQLIKNWDRDDGQGSNPPAEFQPMLTYKAEYTEFLKDHSDWEYTFTCMSGGWPGYCQVAGMMIVIAELGPDESKDDPPHGIEMSVSTSADWDSTMNYLTTGSVTLKGTLFTIYAKLEKNGNAINSEDLRVTGNVICYRETAETMGLGLTAGSTPLLDNGMDPDMTANDGIFSGNFIPLVSEPDYVNGNGMAQVFVTATLKDRSDEAVTQKSIFKSPLPIDQKLIRCGSGYQGCLSEPVSTYFFLHEDLPRRILFGGTEIFPDLRESKHVTTTRITDLRLRENPEISAIFQLVWTEPRVELDNGPDTPKEYVIRFTTKFEDLITLPDNEIGRWPTSPPPQEMGKEIAFDLIDEPGDRDKRRYFFVTAFGDKNDMDTYRSNVVLYDLQLLETPPTTTPSASPSPTTPPTTMISSTAGSTTIPSVSTTEEERTVPSAPHRSTATPTTTRTTMTRPTTEPITTTTPEPDHWYKSKTAIIVFSVFGSGVVLVGAGVFAYLKFGSRLGWSRFT